MTDERLMSRAFRVLHDITDTIKQTLHNLKDAKPQKKAIQQDMTIDSLRQ